MFESRSITCGFPELLSDSFSLFLGLVVVVIVVETVVLELEAESCGEAGWLGESTRGAAFGVGGVETEAADEVVFDAAGGVSII